ncbi:hypothetical protein HYH03_003716 [Edaphochlamys debaryana]|uniref:Uncharacterized protein n=1 Tax=Edaphochlamys debaryana TaxID=47281 RepID=A0A836C465_9CHLO|nr:hypothetical protein HYH03_003716 [Edaphochlamys debaryana]|eukprot:KAG2498462.1 hypothetical protein HYH03_003716 [Edaphochlamys debaryana]
MPNQVTMNRAASPPKPTLPRRSEPRSWNATTRERYPLTASLTGPGRAGKVGTLLGASGGRYEGEVLAGRPHGKGQYYIQKPGGAREWVLQYDGDWIQGRREGYGTRVYNTGETYAGDWVSNLRHGTGRYEYSNGDLYVGQWADDKRTGAGTMYMASGDIFVGNFLSDRREGMGTLFMMARQKKYVAEYVKDQPRCGSVLEIDDGDLVPLKGHLASLAAARRLDAASAGEAIARLPPLQLQQPAKVLAEQVVAVRRDRAHGSKALRAVQAASGTLSERDIEMLRHSYTLMAAGDGPDAGLLAHQLRELVVMAGLDPAAPATKALVEELMRRRAPATGRISFDSFMLVVSHFQDQAVAAAAAAAVDTAAAQATATLHATAGGRGVAAGTGMAHLLAGAAAVAAEKAAAARAEAGEDQVYDDGGYGQASGVAGDASEGVNASYYGEEHSTAEYGAMAAAYGSAADYNGGVAAAAELGPEEVAAEQMAALAAAQVPAATEEAEEQFTPEAGAGPEAEVEPQPEAEGSAVAAAAAEITPQASGSGVASRAGSAAGSVSGAAAAELAVQGSGSPRVASRAGSAAGSVSGAAAAAGLSAQPSGTGSPRVASRVGSAAGSVSGAAAAAAGLMVQGSGSPRVASRAGSVAGSVSGAAAAAEQGTGSPRVASRAGSVAGSVSGAAAAGQGTGSPRVASRAGSVAGSVSGAAAVQGTGSPRVASRVGSAAGSVAGSMSGAAPAAEGSGGGAPAPASRGASREASRQPSREASEAAAAAAGSRGGSQAGSVRASREGSRSSKGALNGRRVHLRAIATPFDLVTPERGFLPSTDPLRRLTLSAHDAAAAEWEAALADVPKLVLATVGAGGTGLAGSSSNGAGKRSPPVAGQGVLRRALASLPPFPTYRLLLPGSAQGAGASGNGGGVEHGAELWRAYMLISFLAHAYMWCEPGPPPSALPATLAVPWVRVAAALAMPPVLTYATFNLSNWRRLDPAQPLRLGNIVCLNNFMGGPDEEWFRLVHIDIEARAGRAVAGLEAMQAAAAQDDAEGVMAGLTAVAGALREMQATLSRMGEACDPYIYFQRVRTPMSGWRNNPDLPQGLIYEGVSEEPMQLYGETGAQSSVLHAFDAALGVRHDQVWLRDYLDSMVDHMPPPHRAFIRRLAAAQDTPACVRTFVTSRGGELREAYNDAVVEMEKFRAQHKAFAFNYIAKFARKEATGTGGSDFMPALSGYREDTARHVLP